MIWIKKLKKWWVDSSKPVEFVPDFPQTDADRRTRISGCINFDCKNNMLGLITSGCNCKEIVIDKKGQCTNFTAREKNQHA